MDDTDNGNGGTAVARGKVEHNSDSEISDVSSKNISGKQVADEWEILVSNLFNKENTILENFSKSDWDTLEKARALIQEKRSLTINTFFNYVIFKTEQEMPDVYKNYTYKFQEHGKSWRISSWHKVLKARFRKGVGSLINVLLLDLLNRAKESQ